MRKRLASKPAQPRSWISLPGYPTLAAAGLSLCLSGGVAGCMSEPTGSPPAPYLADASRDTLPNPTPNLAGGMAYPFVADADLAVDAVPTASAADAGESIDGGLEAGAASPDSTVVTIDPSNMAGGEPYLFIPDAGDETNN